MATYEVECPNPDCETKIAFEGKGCKKIKCPVCKQIIQTCEE